MNSSTIQNIKSFIRIINLDKLEKFFFALFLLSIPIQTRLTFITPQTYLNGSFNEYATFFLYLSDIFLIITLFIYFVNILTFRDNFIITKKHIHGFPHLIPIIFILVTLITWSFTTAFFSEYKNIAFYQTFKLTELLLLFLYLNFRLQWFGFNKFISLVFIAGFFQSLIGIVQYYLQRSLGLKILMESVLSPEIPNVAKIFVDGERIIRAYGTFPHPNVFAGFLILSIFCGVWLFFSHKASKLYKIVSRETILYSFLAIALIAQLTAFIFTFSRTSWLAVILIILIFALLIVKSKLLHICPPKLINTKQSLTHNSLNKLFHVKQFYNLISNKPRLPFIALMLVSLLIIITINWKPISNRTSNYKKNYQESIDNRALYNNIAFRMINTHPVIGVGAKNFTLRMQEFTSIYLESWQFQPAHNIYLLVTSETGIVGLIIFLLFICSVIKISWLDIGNKIVSRLPSEANTLKKTLYLKQNKTIVSRETIYTDAKAGETILTEAQEGETISAAMNTSETILLQIGFMSVLGGFLFIGLFDHYFWTLQQGQLTFWLVLGTIAAFNSQSK